MRKSKPLVVLAFVLSSCSYFEEKPDKLFTLMPPDRTGAVFSNTLTDTEDFNIVEYLNYYNGAGVAAGDINNDGLTDLYFSANQLSNRLFLNKGNFKFKDITESAGVACPGDWKTGVSMADVNGDGLLDIYVCQVGEYKSVQGENHLYINNGDETFTDRTEEYGLEFKGFSTQSLFFDYDNDGDLDMFLLNHAIHSKNSYGRAAIVRYSSDSKTGDRLFKQTERDGKPYFVNVTQPAGILHSRIGYGLGVAAGDVNNDGCIDLYVSNDFHENDYLYINNCNGTFTEKIRISVGHTSKSSMGNDMADFNNDGMLDIMSLDMMPEDEEILKKSAGEELMQVFDMKEDLGYYFQLSRNCLQVNRGMGLFSEIALYAGVYATDWSWAPLFFDADHDGLKDLFITNGIPNRPNDLDYLQYIEDNIERINTFGEERISNTTLIEVMPSDTIANYAFRNNGDLTFTNYASDWGLDQKAFSNGSVYADLDNDGDLDFVTNNVNGNCFIYRNNAESLTENKFLSIKLNGPERNRFGIGVRAEIFVNGKLQVQQMMPARGSMSSVDPVLNFGLGEAERADSVIVYWPGGKREIRHGVMADRTVEFNIADAEVHFVAPGRLPRKTLFIDYSDSIKAQYTHRESNFSDFLYQPLLPHKLSVQGPKIAVGDVNGDGLEDVYICGAAGQSAGLFIQTADGDFIPSEQQEFSRMSDGEETDALFFDADRDGDLDLYVARGSSENSDLHDLFYKNNGSGNFTHASNFIPKAASFSTCVVLCDFNNDEIPDLFVGGRPSLNRYGFSGESRFLLNNGKGKFSDVTGEFGAVLQNLGMVTDAAWADIDGDKQPELVIVGEWMNITILKKGADGFEDITAKAGLDRSAGWWNTIEIQDMDEDGDMDLVVGNLGLNAKIKANENTPATLYAKDFDGNGIIDPVISYYKKDLEVLFPNRDDLIAQIPSVKNKFPNYKSYASIRSVNEIFTADQLSEAVIRKAYNFKSSFLENLGDGTFRIVPLPKEAQLFPVYSVLIKDFDRDGIKDLVLGGNLYRANINYGRYDGGYGLFLKGKGSREFEPFSIAKSGLLMTGEVRDLAIVKTPGKELILSAKSDGPLQIIEIREE